MKTQRYLLPVLLLYLSTVVVVATGHAQSTDGNKGLAGINWQRGPSVGSLNEIAQIKIPEGYVFADGNDTRRIMEASQNPTSGNELGFVAPAGAKWFVIFQFDETGYVRDDEKNSLDSDAMLDSIRRATEGANKERQKRGWPTMSIVGWEQKPRYNEMTHNLEWAVKGESQGDYVINYNTRVLGRRGVMRVTLVTDPGSLTSTLPDFKSVLSGFDFKQGQRYAEFRQGDKMAAYGLSALVVGGAGAVAAKTGLLKYLWKLIAAAGVSVMAFFKKIVSRKDRSQASV